MKLFKSLFYISFTSIYFYASFIFVIKLKKFISYAYHHKSRVLKLVNLIFSSLQIESNPQIFLNW